jgi:hypothetical protein
MKFGPCLIAALILALPACARIETNTPTPMRAGAVSFEKRLVTWKDIRDRNIVMQRFDYSCGAAAMATLMNYYFKDEVKETDILNGVLDTLSNEEAENRQENGFSLLDLKNFAQDRGYRAIGVRLPPTALPDLPGPVMVYIQRKDYKHFAILRGIVGDRVYLADPSRGNIRMPIDRFLEEWSGITLVLDKPGFGLPKEHPLDLENELVIRPELQIAREAVQSVSSGSVPQVSMF